MGILYDIAHERAMRPRSAQCHPHADRGLADWPLAGAKIYNFQYEMSRRLSRDLYAQMAACRACGDEGAVAALLDMVRVVDEFELGIDTGMDAILWDDCMVI